MDYMEYNDMRIRRSAFINQQCRDCGSRVTRLLLGSSGLADDNGSEVFRTQVVDCCNCPQPLASSTLVHCPCTFLEEIFDRWNTSLLKRADFDQQLIDALKNRANSEWHTRAS